MEITAKVVKGVGGLFEVVYGEADARVRSFCRARGNLKRDEQTLKVGDNVLCRELDGEMVILSVLERKNTLIRPALSNIDRLYLTFSATTPRPDLFTIDKMLAIAEHNNIPVTLIITKCDGECDKDKYADIYQKAGYDVFCVSSLLGYGIEELLKYVNDNIEKGDTGVFCGASGVGKSTLLNALFPTLDLSTGDISRKIERGKHTTRTVELFEITRGKGFGYVADTPGFSMLDFTRFDFMELDDLLPAFRELYAYRGECPFSDCTHTKEGECEIVRRVKEGSIAESRHKNYVELYNTLKNKKSYK